MTSALVQTHPLLPEDEAFFRALARDTEPFWAGARSMDETKADFDAQVIPSEDRPVADRHFRLLSRLPSVRAALKSFGDSKGFTENTNAMVYNPLSFMRWHTNSDNPGRRHYFTYTEGDAIFRWKHPDTGEIFDERDFPGWTYRTFVVSGKRPLWHTIWTQKVRLSFGFNSTHQA